MGEEEPALELSMPPTDRWGAFLDRALEAEYRVDMVKAPLERIGGTVCLITAAGAVAQSASRLAVGAPLSSAEAYMPLLHAALMLGGALWCFAAPRLGAPLARTEPVLTATLCALAVTMQFPERLDSVLARHAGAAGGRDRSSDALDGQVIALRFCFWLFVVGVFVPLRPQLFALVAASAWAGVAAGEALGGPASVGRAFAIVVYALVLLPIAFGRRHVMSIVRSQWYFHRTVRATVAERARQTRERAKHALELDKASAAREARSRLIRIVMHDLRSPLLSVANSTAVLRALPPDAPVGRAPVPALLSTLHACVGLMEHIVSDMLDFERVDAGRLALVPTPFALAELLEATRALFAGQAAEKGVALSMRPLDAPLASLRLRGDVRRLEQCLNNGVSNALKFTPAGGWILISASALDDGDARGAPADTAPASCGASPGRAARLSSGLRSARDSAGSSAGPPARVHPLQPGVADAQPSRARDSAGSSAGPPARVHPLQPGVADAQSICIEVRDSGYGLSASQLAALGEGEMFTQVGQGQLQGNGGTGLGLVVTRQLVALHGGTLHLHSEGEGKGTTFQMRLQLPVARQPAGAPEAGRDAPAASPAPEPARRARAFPEGFRVLHVEDDAFLRLTLPMQTFGALGVPFDQAEDGAQALELASRTNYAAVVLDNQMPRLTGAETARELRANGYRGLIIGMTGDPTGSRDRDDFQQAGLDVCLDKDTAGVDRIVSTLSSFALPER